MSTVLERAYEAVQQRGKRYGDSRSHHALTAKLWSAYLGREVTPVEVCICMALDKIARQRHDPGYADNYDDLAGYADRAGHNAGANSAPAACHCKPSRTYPAPGLVVE